jgi:hypothetical protein
MNLTTGFALGKIMSMLFPFSYADMAELADAPDLGSGGQPCRFKSCYPHFRAPFCVLYGISKRGFLYPLQRIFRSYEKFPAAAFRHTALCKKQLTKPNLADIIIQVAAANAAMKSEYADMAELADALDSGSNEGNFMEVQVLLSAPKQKNRTHRNVSGFFFAFMPVLLIKSKAARNFRAALLM